MGTESILRCFVESEFLRGELGELAWMTRALKKKIDAERERHAAKPRADSKKGTRKHDRHSNDRDTTGAPTQKVIPMGGWYIHRPFERLGPFTTEAIRQMVADGVIEPSQVVWMEADGIIFHAQAGLVGFSPEEEKERGRSDKFHRW
jgi:hypothetical protein